MDFLFGAHINLAHRIVIQWIEVLKLGSLEIGGPVWSGPTALLHSLGTAWVELVSLFTSELVLLLGAETPSACRSL